MVEMRGLVQGAEVIRKGRKNTEVGIRISPISSQWQRHREAVMESRGLKPGGQKGAGQKRLLQLQSTFIEVSFDLRLSVLKKTWETNKSLHVVFLSK